MSKAAKVIGANNTANNEVPFEEALKRLESIVAAMEDEDLPLETLLARYEEGVKLSQLCLTKLSDAEQKIQQLEKNAAGEEVLSPVKLADTETDKGI